MKKRLSGLSRTVVKDGWKLEIAIFEDGAGGWLLEVIDDMDTATCWTEPFANEQAALDEALRAIEADGAEAFSEAQPWRTH